MAKTNLRKKSKNLAIWIFLAALLIFLTLAALIFGVYRSDWDNRLLKTAENAIPFPALYIKGAGFINIDEIKEDNQAIRKFYESQDFDKVGMRVDFSTEQGEKRLKVTEKGIINKLVENKIVIALAEKRDISITDAIVDQQVNSSIDEFGNRQNLMSDLARLYGWSLDDFKKKVVKPELYAGKLSEIYKNEIDIAEQEAKANSLRERVASKKEDFAKVATETSEGESAKNGGDLGWSTESQLVPEISEKAFSMQVGEISPVIRSSLGFHIIKLEEKKLRIILTRRPEKYNSQTVEGQLEFSGETPRQLVKRLTSIGYKEILLVGGSIINGLFLKQNLVDELYLTIEPKLFGSGKNIIEGQLLNKSLRLISVKKLNKVGTLLLKYKIIK